MGKPTPLDDLPEMKVGDEFYVDAMRTLRKFAAPIGLPDLAAYCQMFPVRDKQRLMAVAATLNIAERKNG